MTHIVLIEDDASVRKLIGEDLELEGYRVTLAADGLAGLEAVRRLKPDLIIMDVMMPKMTGYDVCRTLRREGVDAPILMLTAKGQEAEKVLGLDLGADEYVVKPVGSHELQARVRALLRRRAPARETLPDAGFLDVKVSFRKMEALKNGKPLTLTRKEFQILELLLRHRGDVVSRDQFLEDIWGYDSAEYPNTRTVDTQVMTLRQKLAGKRGDPSAYIQTVHGIGYKFVA